MSEKRPSIERLTLAVSNACRMACRYCYANHGGYYSPGLLMKRETAFAAVNLFARSFARIWHINFFGGEPTLNEPIISLVCEYCGFLHQRGVLAHLPSFGVTTAGCGVSERMLQTLVAHNVSVTVSLDGPREIHDFLRPTKGGERTYDRVVRMIDKLRCLGIMPEFECTYTAEHLRRGIDVVDLIDFFHGQFGCRTLHCTLVITEETSPWFIPLEVAAELYAAAIRYSVENLVCGEPKSISVANRLLTAIATGAPIEHYCPAGRTTLTVNADGSIYACFMLMDPSRFCLGNVCRPGDAFTVPNELAKLLSEAEKGENAACRRCWARSLCFGCLGEDLSRQGSRLQRSEVPGRSALCDFKRGVIKEFLKSAARAAVVQPQAGQLAD